MSRTARVITRLREPSSLAGLAALAILAGRSVEEAQTVATAIGAVLGVAAVLVPESGKKTTTDNDKGQGSEH